MQQSRTSRAWRKTRGCHSRRTDETATKQFGHRGTSRRRSATAARGTRPHRSLEGVTAGHADQVKLAMGRAEEMLLAMRIDLERDNDPPIQAATNGALDAVVHALDGAVNGAVTKLTSPLANLRQYLEKLITNPTNLFNPSSYVDAQVNAVQAQVGDVMLALAEDVTRDAKTTLGNLRPALERLQEGAVVARHVADTMGNLAHYGNEDALKALNDLLPPVNPSTPPNSRSTLVAHVTRAVPTLKMQNKQASIDTALGENANGQDARHVGGCSGPSELGRIGCGDPKDAELAAARFARCKSEDGRRSSMACSVERPHKRRKQEKRPLGRSAEAVQNHPGTLRKVEDYINQQTRLRVH